MTTMFDEKNEKKKIHINIIIIQMSLIKLMQINY